MPALPAIRHPWHTCLCKKGCENVMAQPHRRQAAQMQPAQPSETGRRLGAREMNLRTKDLSVLPHLSLPGNAQYLCGQTLRNFLRSPPSSTAKRQFFGFVLKSSIFPPHYPASRVFRTPPAPQSSLPRENHSGSALGNAFTGKRMMKGRAPWEGDEGRRRKEEGALGLTGARRTKTSEVWSAQWPPPS